MCEHRYEPEAKDCGYIDQTGKYVINPQFNAGAGDFSEGLAVVCERLGGSDLGCTFVDKTGKPVFSKKYKSADKFSDGWAYVQPDGYGGDGHTYINHDGKPPDLGIFFGGTTFSEGYAAVRNERDGKWEYIGKDYWNVTTPLFDEARNFSDGMALVRIGDKWGYIDKSYFPMIVPEKEGLTKLAIEAPFDVAGDFSEGLAAVKVANKWGYIDKAGKIVINPQFEFAGSFLAGLAPVTSGKCGEAYPHRPYWGYNCRLGYIDKTGKYVWNPTN